MDWSLTTISFRMHLHSADQIAAFAKDCGFAGIELWEPHERNGSESWRSRQTGQLPKLVALSGYLDVTDFSMQLSEWRGELARKLAVCKDLDIPILRLFTGRLAGTATSEDDWLQFFARLCYVEELAEAYEIDVVFETHPGTLLDGKEEVDRFLQAVERNRFSRIGLNFDAFHVWEFDGDAISNLKRWYTHVKHVHVKNAVGRTRAFDPANVFSPYGSFEDLTSLAHGVVEIAEIVRFLRDRGYNRALTVEWLGRPDMEFLKGEVDYLNAVCAPRIAHAAAG